MNTEKECFIVKIKGLLYACQSNIKKGNKIISLDGKIHTIDSVEIDFGGISLFPKKGNVISYSSYQPEKVKIQSFDKEENPVELPLLKIIGELPPELYFKLHIRQKVVVKQLGATAHVHDIEDLELCDFTYRFLAVKCDIGCFHQLNREIRDE